MKENCAYEGCDSDLITAVTHFGSYCIEHWHFVSGYYDKKKVEKIKWNYHEF